MASVSVTNITKSYSDPHGREVTALDGLSLEIEDRDFVVLVGPAGSGLSAIIRVIAGLDNVSRGEILIGGRRVNDLPPKDRDLAVVFRNHQPYPAMSVLNNIAFGLKQRKFSEAEMKKRVLNGAETLGLTPVLEKKAKSLSVEQRQRLAIARATALQPEVILFDEPLANLNRKAQTQLRDEIMKLHQRLRATMIYATHDPTEALAMGNRVVVICNGKIQQDGTGRALYEEPENVFVAEFFGNPPTNLIRGELRQDQDGLFFSEAEEGTIKLRWPVAQSGAAAQALLGRQVLLGIRPKEIRVMQATSSKGEKHAGRFPAIIDHVEKGEGEIDLYLYTGSHRIVCRTEGGEGPWEAGHRIEFEVTPSRVRLFDPLSGANLVLSA